MSFYQDMQDVVSDVMDEFKQGLIELVQITPGSGSPDNPGIPTESKTTLSGASKGVSYKYLSNSAVVATDVEVTSAVVAGITPNIRDFIEIDGVRHKIVADMSVPAAGIKAAWKFIVRKGG